MKHIIIGGVAGGATAAARIRRVDEFAEIVLFEKGKHISFANCGLPYYIGGVIEQRDALFLQTPASFLDVRNPAERVGGNFIKSSLNIPLDELRERLDEIPQDKPVYVYCAVGLRGYLASQILLQRGFASVKNLSGGYKTYMMATYCWGC